MRFGFQTILWGRDLSNEDAEKALRLISEAGFKGVEFAQTPSRLPPAEVLMELLGKYDLDLIGVAGGSIRDKCDLLEALKPYWSSRVAAKAIPKPYVYVEETEEPEFKKALDTGYRLAIHCHYPKAADDSFLLLKKYQTLEWLPDTAHLFIEYLDTARVVRAITPYKDRLAAVHLKDWKPEYGRTSYRYAKGFTELGLGEVHPEIVLTHLDTLKYRGWVVTELDYTQTDPSTSVFKCAEWLHQYKRLPEKPAYQPAEPSVSCDVSSPLTLFSRLVAKASFGRPTFHADAAACLNALVPSVTLAIWSFEATRETYSVLALHPEAEPLDDDLYKVGRYFSSVVRRAGQRLCFDLTLPHPAEGRDADFEPEPHDLLVKHGKKLLVVPVYNTYNSHQVRFFLHFLLAGEEPAAENLADVGKQFGKAAELWVTEQSVTAAVEVSQLASKHHGYREFLQGLRGLIHRRLRCEGVSVFMVEPPGDRFLPIDDEGIEWAPGLLQHQRFYQKGDGQLTSRMLENPRPLLIRNVSRYRTTIPGLKPTGKSWEKVKTEGKDTCLFWPFMDRNGKLLGVVRARNKYNRQGEIRPFSDDDLALVEAIMQLSIADLELMKLNETRQNALGRLFHELEQPLFSTKSALFTAQEELDDLDKDLGHHTLNQDYIGDALSWIELANRLLKSFDFLNWEHRGLQPDKSWVLPVKDIIAPAVRQVKALIAERQFSEKRIDYGNEDEIKKYPKLNIDKNMFQQVFFNLLSNAIKYASPTASAFRVQIRAEVIGSHNIIYFRDWGRGIPEGWREAVFAEGARVQGVGPYILGRGLGLWVVRRILELHKGSIKLTCLKDPTEFTITLPRS
jgi:signal transduction histidine kinase/sugar phosphate isomerase/epimerase